MNNIVLAEFLIMSVFGGYFAYMAISTLLLKATDNTRESLFELGNALINRSDIEDCHKRELVELFGLVFSWRLMIGLIVGIMRSTLGFGNLKLTDSDRKFVSDKQVVRFFSLHLKALSAANPIWAIVLFAVLILTSVIQILRLNLFYYREIWLDALKWALTSESQVHLNSEKNFG